MMYERPWGKFQVLLEEENHKTKRIEVNPYQQFSLQYHNHRDEYWIVVDGSGKIIIDGNEYDAKPKNFYHIPKTSVHRASADGNGLVFIEVQIGNCYEEDIVRLHDDYGRD